MFENQLQEYYYKVEMPKVRQKVAEFKAEMGGWGKCKRLDYLYDRLIELDLELLERQRAYELSAREDKPYFERALIASYIPEIEKKIKKFEREIAFIVKSAKEPQGRNQISPEIIEQAREYPIESLVDVKRGIALCPFHEDHHPSMGIKNNRFHCFACGAKGDVIEFLMKRDGISFAETVRRLSL